MGGWNKQWEGSDVIQLESVNLCLFETAGPMRLIGSGKSWAYPDYRFQRPVPLTDDQLELLVWIVSSSVKQGPGDKKWLEEIRKTNMAEFSAGGV